MLIFGACCNDWKEKAAYASDKSDNELSSLIEVRCAAIDDVQLAMAAIASMATGSNCKKFLYHATINLRPGERLSPEQWREVVDKLEDNLKLTGHHRIIFEHVKKNRQHYHVYWARIPPEGGGPAATLQRDYAAHKKVALWAEKAFGLKLAPRKKQQDDIASKHSDQHRAKTSATVTQIYKDSKTTKEFTEALTKAGFELAYGRNGSLLIVDQSGHYQTLLRRLDGVRKADLYKKFPDLSKIQFRPLSLILSGCRPKAKNRMINKSFRRAGKKVTKVCRSRGPYARRAGSTHYVNKSKNTLHAPRPVARATGNYADMQGETMGTGTHKKKGEGKGDGAGGGAASSMSALKSSPKPRAPSLKKYSGDDIGKGNGPERRRHNMWVAVERRQQGPRPK